MSKKNRFWRRLSDPEREIQCPNCGTLNTRLVRTFANFVRLTLSYLAQLFLGIVAIVLSIILGDGPDEDLGLLVWIGNRFAIRRKCRRCGTIFAPKRIISRRLDQCVKCDYSLIGNISGRCPECGWKLRRTHRRFVKKRGTAIEPKSRETSI